MSKQLSLFLTLIVFSFQIQSQIPHPALVGYWQNWNDVNAPHIPIDQVDGRYNVINVSFAIPQAGTDYRMEFIPDQGTPAAFISKIQTLQSQGKKVLISIGGATAPVSLNNVVERDSFINSMTRILNNYGFDGMDIDLEGSSLALTGGTINAPIDLPVIHLVEAVKQIMDNYRINFNRKMLLTMAPETAFVQGGMSAFGSIWGAYLPVIHALRDSMDLLQVQLYNSGSMYGIDGGIYTQGTADFIVAMTEAVIQGFTTGGGTFQDYLHRRWRWDYRPARWLQEVDLRIRLPLVRRCAISSDKDLLREAIR
jgi:chitinase